MSNGLEYKEKLKTYHLAYFWVVGVVWVGLFGGYCKQGNLYSLDLLLLLPDSEMQGNELVKKYCELPWLLMSLLFYSMFVCVIVIVLNCGILLGWSLLPIFLIILKQLSNVVENKKPCGIRQQQTQSWVKRMSIQEIPQSGRIFWLKKESPRKRMSCFRKGWIH